MGPLFGTLLTYSARLYDYHLHFINSWRTEFFFPLNLPSQAPSLKAWLFLTRAQQQSNHILSWSQARLLVSVLPTQKAVSFSFSSPFHPSLFNYLPGRMCLSFFCAFYLLSLIFSTLLPRSKEHQRLMSTGYKTAFLTRTGSVSCSRKGFVRAGKS